MANTSKKGKLRIKRKLRIRKKISGSQEMPRLSVFRSARHIYAQVINDINGATLAAIHSYDNEKRASIDECKKLGIKLAEKCKAANITKVVFDKNGYAYHGRVKALADGAREGGLTF